MANPIVFFGCEAFLCKVTGERKCKVWLRDPRELDFDEGMAVELDLSKNPFENPSSIQLDNHEMTPKDPGLTTLGPSWPNAASHNGGVWVTPEVLAKVPESWRSLPPSGEDYRWQTLRYADQGGKIRRYSGFHAELVRQEAGHSRFRIWNALDDVADSAAVELLVAVATDVEAAHSQSFGSRGVSPFSSWTPGEKGKLFLSWEFVKSTNGVLLISPKLPIGHMDPTTRMSVGRGRRNSAPLREAAFSS